MITDDPINELFRKAAFVWSLVLVVNIVLLVGFISEGKFGDSTWIAYFWFVINFIPLTIAFIVIRSKKRKFELVAQGKQLVFKALFPIFGLACIASLWFPLKNMDTPGNLKWVTYLPIAYLIIQYAIWWHLPKPKKKN